jgi:hypothetical protein
MTLGNYTGTDGLRIKDFPEMRVENGQVTFDKTQQWLSLGLS